MSVCFVCIDTTRRAVCFARNIIYKYFLPILIHILLRKGFLIIIIYNLKIENTKYSKPKSGTANIWYARTTLKAERATTGSIK